MKKIVLFILIIQLSCVIYAQESNKTYLGAPPIDYKSFELKSSDNSNSSDELDVPAYLWSYGCTPTWVAMIMAYYDTHGFPCMLNDKSINGGVAPLYNDSWDEDNLPEGYGNYYNPMSANRKDDKWGSNFSSYETI